MTKETERVMGDALLDAWMKWYKEYDTDETHAAKENPTIPFEQGFQAAWRARQKEIDRIMEALIDEKKGSNNARD